LEALSPELKHQSNNNKKLFLNGRWVYEVSRTFNPDFLLLGFFSIPRKDVVEEALIQL
jgi:hypothetical protein